ncbi:phasin family protein [Mesorhizobium australicum]|uniref:Phasin family protein n=1 Tax=Mesorhizobium australicum TaxID=536018 RepID=A0A1X7P9T6_9HYPH|nr:TIGR01841 family phasin [Mesorhizobium australicum]SMH47148.1 phasin family protein [Mesorhizobium australicum]
MAKKTDNGSFIDMFKSFGEELKMPSVDVDKIIEHHRKNLETLEKTAKAATAGASSLMDKQRRILEETLREVSDMAQDFRASGGPQELMSKQADFARRSFETAVKNASEMADVVRKSSTETIEILRDRIKEAMEEIREGMERKK